MPGFSNTTKFYLGRGLKTFLGLEAGVTRGATPDEQARAQQARMARTAQELSERTRELRAARAKIREQTALQEDDGIPGRLLEGNRVALANRPFLREGYAFRPIQHNNRAFHGLKEAYPYFGYVCAEVEGVPSFVMFSNNDDQVAQTYFWFGPDAFESLSLRVWRELARHSAHVFDIGAFSGVYALTAALANRRAEVHCFEPIRRIYGRLVANLSANGLHGRVKAHNIALDETDGEAIINVFAGRFTNLLTGASLVEKKHRETVGGEPVETLRFDAFVEEHDVPGVDLVKIDVEQAEKQVVAGMEGVLEEHRPHMLVEVISEEGLRDLTGTLSPHGYNFAVINDRTQKAAVNDPGAHGTAYNVLFSPMPEEELRTFCEKIKPLPYRKADPSGPPDRKEG